MSANEGNLLLSTVESINDEVTKSADESSKEFTTNATEAAFEIPAQDSCNQNSIDSEDTKENDTIIAEIMDVPNFEQCKETIENITEISIGISEKNETIVVMNESSTTTKQPSQDVISAGLTMLSQYDSDVSENDEETLEILAESTGKKDSDIESVVEIFSNVNDYRSKIVELSSDSDNDSTSSSSSSSSSVAATCTSNLDGESSKKSNRSLKHLRKVIDKRITAAGTDDDDEDDEIDENGVSKIKRRIPPKVKGEMLLEDLPPIEDLHITVPEDECIELGRVHSIVDQLLLVTVLPNSLLLDLDTVLFLEKGKRVLGAVFDVLGPVAAPLYCVRFNSNAQIHEKEINVGAIVYVAPKTEYTQFVILSSLIKLRGSDASWENDVEPPQRFLDYSDDEQERQARSRLRNKDRQEPTESNIRNKRLNNNDDDDDNASVSDTMSIMSESTVASEYSTRGHWRGGRARGNRGRGGRSRGMPTYNSHSHVPQIQENIQNYAQNYDNSSWHTNLYPPQPYAFGPYGGMPPPPPQPPAGMGYYQYIPPSYAYANNYMPYPPHSQQMPPFQSQMQRPPSHQEHKK